MAFVVVGVFTLCTSLVVTVIPLPKAIIRNCNNQIGHIIFFCAGFTFHKEIVLFTGNSRAIVLHFEKFTIHQSGVEILYQLSTIAYSHRTIFLKHTIEWCIVMNYCLVPFTTTTFRHKEETACATRQAVNSTWIWILFAICASGWNINAVCQNLNRLNSFGNITHGLVFIQILRHIVWIWFPRILHRHNKCGVAFLVWLIVAGRNAIGFIDSVFIFYSVVNSTFSLAISGVAALPNAWDFFVGVHLFEQRHDLARICRWIR